MFLPNHDHQHNQPIDGFFFTAEKPEDIDPTDFVGIKCEGVFGCFLKKVGADKERVAVDLAVVHVDEKHCSEYEDELYVFEGNIADLKGLQPNSLNYVRDICFFDVFDFRLNLARHLF